jgi:hypothetical protein
MEEKTVDRPGLLMEAVTVWLGLGANAHLRTKGAAYKMLSSLRNSLHSAPQRRANISSVFSRRAIVGDLLACQGDPRLPADPRLLRSGTLTLAITHPPLPCGAGDLVARRFPLHGHPVTPVRFCDILPAKESAHVELACECLAEDRPLGAWREVPADVPPVQSARPPPLNYFRSKHEPMWRRHSSHIDGRRSSSPGLSGRLGPI